MATNSKHLTGDVVVERLTVLVYELNMILRMAPMKHVKVDIDFVDRPTHTEVVMQIGKR